MFTLWHFNVENLFRVDFNFKNIPHEWEEKTKTESRDAVCTCRAGGGLLAGGWHDGFVRHLTGLFNVSPRDHRIQ